MNQVNTPSTSANAYDAKTLAKKHRISVEDAIKIVGQYGADRKASDKAARRIAVYFRGEGWVTALQNRGC
jgi:hypothetical protein